MIELHYLPCIQYFAYLNSFEKIIIDQNDKFVKQTYRNRCRINGANKVEDLIIPIQKAAGKSKMYCDVLIDNNQKWLKNHLRAIQSAYGKAPFFEYYADEIFDVFYKNQISLISLSKELLTKCLELLDMKLNIEFTKNIIDSEANVPYNAINEINPKKSILGNSIFTPTKYFQVFGSNFANNLSIIDLIFCEGPQAKQIIENSCLPE